MNNFFCQLHKSNADYSKQNRTLKIKLSKKRDGVTNRWEKMTVFKRQKIISKEAIMFEHFNNREFKDNTRH